MGAQNIDFELKGKATQSEIEAKFNSQQRMDRSENGTQEGYSGDFQTVDKVDNHTDKVFTDYNEAYDYCLKEARKGETVVAVYYATGPSQFNTLVAGWGAC